MFARTISFHLKPGLTAADGAQAIGISLWDLPENADAYARTDYAAVVKALEHVVQGTPLVTVYGVASSTLHSTVPVRAI